MGRTLGYRDAVRTLNGDAEFRARLADFYQVLAGTVTYFGTGLAV